MNEEHQPGTPREFHDVRAPSLSGAVGVVIIVTAFVVAVINASQEMPNTFIAMTLQPFIFLGIGALLSHIGRHVHAIHENTLAMANMNAARAMKSE